MGAFFMESEGNTTVISEIDQIWHFKKKNKMATVVHNDN